MKNTTARALISCGKDLFDLMTKARGQILTDIFSKISSNSPSFSQLTKLTNNQNTLKW